ncbi:Nickel-dependent lactate racemase [Geosporobacter subterraneus DSM 17957]|uniref:Nickel-dependent lactate racemase n=1 Tax=Geosporobacter subterraneus DSM 17957 TaxID=1121919 RepID=A0A1M6NR64_9FIRM|nr:nickel-dependent lactate racemase [Geosporobacter subterraneus]SHJ98184.1 Nickel-dependent lactate racemase [Geosporobacter subterraneus DSM 17957]
MAEYPFKYGNTQYNFKIERGELLHLLKPRPAVPIADVHQKCIEALENPIGTLPLRQIISPGENVLLIVSDITRAWIRTNQFLVHIINYLNGLSIPDQDISVLIALGTHRPSTEEEKKQIVGEEIYNRIAIYDHDCFDPGQLENLGTSSAGTPIQIHKRVVAADRVILTGGIVFHLFAGFGGGAKGIVPGVAGLETIQHNHRLTFYEGESAGLNPDACSNKIEGNPMRQDITEICRRVNPDFLFNAVLDAEGNFIEFVAGDFEAAWLKGCNTIRQLYGIEVKEKADLIIASAGGYPKDINLYQSVKTMDNCIFGGKEDSVILLLAECRDGLGADEFLEWFQYDTLEKMEAALKRNFTVPGYAAYKAAYVAKYRKLVLLSSLEDEVVGRLGFIPARSMEEAISLAYSLAGEQPKITLMPYGANTLPILA